MFPSSDQACRRPRFVCRLSEGVSRQELSRAARRTEGITSRQDGIEGGQCQAVGA